MRRFLKLAYPSPYKTDKSKTRHLVFWRERFTEKKPAHFFQGQFLMYPIILFVVV
jgi:hypothetical protein